MKKSVFGLLVTILFLMSGCGTSSPNLSKKQNANLNLNVKKPIVLIVAHTKDDKWVPETMFTEPSSGSTRKAYLGLYLLASHYEKIPFIFKGNNFYIWGDHCTLKRDGQSCDCTRINGKETFCKYNTPFFDNGVLGMRAKPYGVVDFNKEKTIAYFQKHHILKKIKIFNEIIMFNSEKSEYFKNLENKEFQDLRNQIQKILSQYIKQKPKIKFIALNEKIKGAKFDVNKITFNHNFYGLYQSLSIFKNFKNNSSVENMRFENNLKIHLPKAPVLKIAYNFENDLIYIYTPNNKQPKKFKIQDIEKIKQFIDNFYKKQKTEYIEKLKNRKKEIINAIKQKTNYVIVYDVECTKKHPCSTVKSIYKINYYFTNVKPKDKLYLNKLNIVKVDGSREVLKNAVLQKPNVVFEDKNLKIAVINNEIHLINKTKNFIKVKSLAEYIKDKIYNLGNYVLPPEADKTIDSVHKIPFNSLDENIFYGFAVSYELNGKEYNFYKHKTFSAKDLIK